MKQIGFVGLGQMGEPMAQNLLKNHFSLPYLIGAKILFESSWRRERKTHPF
ncbi:MAG: NAD(P)-binding domain-containing protein [Nitrososphaerales archaeon]